MGQILILFLPHYRHVVRAERIVNLTSHSSSFRNQYAIQSQIYGCSVIFWILSVPTTLLISSRKNLNPQSWAKKGHLLIVHIRKKLTVPNVEQRLKLAGID